MTTKYIEIDRAIETALLLLEEGEDEQTLAYNAALVAFIKNMENVPAADVEPRWIPCDKGEPDEDTECWVTVKTTDALYRGNFTKRYGERRNKGFITSDGFMWWNTALAWMPIYEPEPYNAESEGEK